MLNIQYLVDVVYFIVIAISPMPLCLSIAFINSSERYKKYNKNQTESLSFSKLLLIITTGWCVISTVVCLLLGILGWFNLRYIIYFDVILFISGIGFWRYLKINNILPLYFQHLVKIIQSITKNEWIILSSICFVGLVLMERSVTRPLIDYDSLWYHLPNMVSWYQSSSLKMVDTIGDIVFDQTIRYPYNWELLSTLLVMPFRDDFLVTLTKVISWFILGVSIYRISLRFGANRLSSLAASSLVLTTPFILLTTNTMEIDVPLSAFFLASLSFAMDYSEHRKMLDLSMFSLCLGMLLGIKTSSIFYGGLLVAFIAVTAVIHIGLRHKSSHNYKTSVSPKKNNILILVITFLLCSVLLCLFWYIRNFVELGNPLGYVQVNLGDFTIFPGKISAKDIKATSLANLFNLTNLSHWQIIGMQALVRLQLPFIAIILQIVAGLYILITRKRKIKPQFIIGIALLLIATGWLYWNTPGSGAPGLGEGKEITAFVGYEFRYGFSFLSILGIAAAMSATLAATPEKIIVILVTFSSLASLMTYILSDLVKTATFTGTSEILWASKIVESIISNPSQFFQILNNAIGNSLFSIGIYGILYIGLMLLIFWQPNYLKFNLASLTTTWTRRTITALICLLLLTTTSIVARERRDILRKEFYGGIYDYIEQNISPTERIGYLLTHRIYLFSGKNWDRNVVYAAPDSSESLTEWINDLKERGISVLAVGPVRDPSTRELAWLEAPDGSFTRVFGEDFNRESLIYRLD
ncbi:hypothetical protein [Coleofasciculus chthonoplastes]|uniref:hypothetical protein n=1 Tax=Coleofasciculus chthonoplastes TaxID=64178 RepID=UPI0032F581D1